MVTVPAVAWRGGSFQRALTIGVCAGVFFGLLALIDSGIPLVALVVFVILGAFYGIWMARRTARYWPGAKELNGADRVTVVDTSRRGARIGEARLAPAVIDYGRGIHAAAEKARPYRWLVWFLLAVAAGVAVWDTVFGSTRDVVSSCLYIGLLALELFWWPKRQDELLTNADRAGELARQVLAEPAS